MSNKSNSSTSDNKGDIESYSDRFNPTYLNKLLNALSPEELIKGRHKELSKTGDKKKECIEINFCGNAANSLFGHTSGRTAISEESKHLLVNINKAFLHLFDEEILKKFDNNSIYLKVRVCFAYPYSDFPVCMMKAEEAKNWEHITAPGAGYNLHLNKKLKEQQLKGSAIYISQENTLKAISKLIKYNPSLLNRVSESHSIQVRFSVIPSPLCLLLINNCAYCDSYLYAIIKNENESELHEFSLRYPVSIIKNDINTDKQFESVQMHFDYLWKHDLTIFCEDATFFEKKKNNYEKLAQIKTPCEVEWKDKEKRMRLDHANSMAFLKKENIPFPENEFQEWKTNVEKKFKLATSKVLLDTPWGENLSLANQNVVLKNIIDSLKKDYIEDKVQREYKAWLLKPIYQIIITLIVGLFITYGVYFFFYRAENPISFISWSWIKEDEFAKEFSVKSAVEVLFKMFYLITPTYLFIKNFMKKFRKNEKEKKLNEIRTKYSKDINEKYVLNS